MDYIFNNPERVLTHTWEHMYLVGISVLVAMLIGIPIGILITRRRWLEGPVIKTTGILYTIPSLALFAVLIPLTSLGKTTAIIALTLYSLLAVIRNTAAGIDSVNPALLDAARGMGMTGTQRLLFVELPLAVPVIVAGVRVATVAGIGIATVADTINAGGLGRLIFDGLSTNNPPKIVAGAIMASVLALLADWGLGRLGTALRRDATALGR